jgi:hypothetical protein
MADLVADSLNQNITTLTDSLAGLNGTLSQLSNDGDYSWFQSRVNILKAANMYNKTDSHGRHYWADSSGTIWVGDDSQNEYAKAIQYMGDVNQHIANVTAQIADIKNNQLPTAQTALSDYLKGKQNDPSFILAQTEQTSQLTQNANALAKTTGTTTIVIWSIVAVIVISVVIGTIIYFKKRKKANA